jgi:hypothetical protein
MIQINEVTEQDKLLSYLDPNDWDNFYTAWYYGLDPYKENPEALIMMANAVLTHWHVPLYAESIDWDDGNDCFIWHFEKRII